MRVSKKCVFIFSATRICDWDYNCNKTKRKPVTAYNYTMQRLRTIFGNINKQDMSGYSQRGGFTLTWTIENFAYSGMQTGERMKSEFFYAYSLEWCLMLYPRGKDDGNYITVEFYGNGGHEIPFDFLFSILDSEGTPLTWKEAKVKSRRQHINFVRRDEVFGPRKTTFLPNNTLTIQCRILKTGEAFSTPLLRCMRTRVEENRSFLKWGILNFGSLGPRQPITKDFPPMTRSRSYLNIKLFLDDEEKVKFIILRTRGGALEWGFATCKVVALDAMEKKVIFAESEHFFERNNKVWQFTSYFTKSMLRCDQSLFLPNGTLTLVFECTLSSGVEYSRMVDPPTTSTNQGANSAVPTADVLQDSSRFDPPDSLSRDLLGLYETCILSDFNLRIQDKTFPVHKQILSARSPVFRAMFTVDMKEKVNESIEIQDMDADTLQKMLLSIYADKVQEDMQWNEASKLYVAADRYELQSLKDRCATFLKTSVSVLNVCEILVLADMHQDEDLKSTTLDFILEHDAQLIGTEQWKKFEKENAQLSSETFRALYLKKINKD